MFSHTIKTKSAIYIHKIVWDSKKKLIRNMPTFYMESYVNMAISHGKIMIDGPVMTVYM